MPKLGADQKTWVVVLMPELVASHRMCFMPVLSSTKKKGNEVSSDLVCILHFNFEVENENEPPVVE